MYLYRITNDRPNGVKMLILQMLLDKIGAFK